MLHDEKVLGFIWSQPGALPVTGGVASLVECDTAHCHWFYFGAGVTLALWVSRSVIPADFAI